MKVSMIGLGYIGLPTAAVFADNGVEVIGVDVSEKVVNTINEGKIHIVEEGLEELVKKVVSQGNLRAVTAPEPADAFLIAVPTPFKNDFEPDLKFVEAAARNIAPVLKKGDIVILESTSPVGTTEKMAEILAEMRTDLSFPQNAGENADINIAYCPERVIPGKTLEELITNDRSIGGMTPACAKKAADLYKIFVKGDCIITDAKTAEMIKLTENSFRDVNIAFANELSIICDELGISVWEVIDLANRHPRVNILQPGPGVGGHCIAVDPWFIVDSAPSSAKIIRLAREINDNKPQYVIDKVKQLAGDTNPTIACLGLAFKPDVDDLRGSPALYITKKLIEEGIGSIIAVEPNVSELPDELKGCQLVAIDEALKADIIVLLVDHSEFKNMDKNLLQGKTVLDTKGVV